VKLSIVGLILSMDRLSLTLNPMSRSNLERTSGI